MRDEEYIKRGALKAHYAWLPKDAMLTPKDFDDIIDAQSAVDAVSVEAYKQIMWERDMAIEQLAEYGVSLGEKKRDVEPVVRCGKCKYAEISSDGFIETCEYWNDEFDTFHLTTMHPNGYCSNGVERSGDA